MITCVMLKLVPIRSASILRILPTLCKKYFMVLVGSSPDIPLCPSKTIAAQNPKKKSRGELLKSLIFVIESAHNWQTVGHTVKF